MGVDSVFRAPQLDSRNIKARSTLLRGRPTGPISSCRATNIPNWLPVTQQPRQHERAPELHPQQRGCVPKVQCQSSACSKQAKAVRETRSEKTSKLTFFPCYSRNRLPSLYSDFTLQLKTNPDGYAVNVAAWEQALNRAAKRGYTSSRGVRVRTGSTSSQKSASSKRKKTDHLVLRTDESLLRDLEIPEWGRPVALGAVFVCGHLHGRLL